MKHTLTQNAGRLAVAALLLGAMASGRGDDAVDPLETPLPLFAPSDSIQLMPREGAAAPSGAPIESKEVLYERLRQSLLNLEDRLKQERDQQLVVPEPPPETAVAPNVVTQTDPVETEASPLVEQQPSDPETDPMSEENGYPDPTDIGPLEMNDDPSQSSSSISLPAAPALAELTIASPNVPALADNLYALGEYDLAYNSYQQLDEEDLSDDDQIWVTFQMAGCLRNLDEHDRAAVLYRQVLSQHPEHHLAGVSRWWLDAMEDNAEQRQAAAAFRATLERLKELHDATVTP